MKKNTAMDYSISLRLPEGWLVESETYIDESGAEVAHTCATIPGKTGQDALIDIYFGEMPEDDTAEDQAFVNYMETVGFSDDDPEDFNPVERIKFNGKNAFCFDAICEGNAPMKFISQEVKKGMLAIIVVVALNDNLLNESMDLCERGFRVRKEGE
ncbi:MAG: hypothetical protein HUJ93_02660 [Bacteroidales bacterium]|nr:hypothetical protein [Bacteroidales bacterium]